MTIAGFSILQLLAIALSCATGVVIGWGVVQLVQIIVAVYQLRRFRKRIRSTILRITNEYHDKTGEA